MNFEPFFTKENSLRRPAFFATVAAAMLLVASVFTACDKEEEPIPSYIRVEPWVMQSTDPSVHGSVAHKITHADMFLYDALNNKNISIGTYELPATVPVLATGDFQLNADPVIRGNGSVYYLQTYPFYERYTTNLTLAPNADTEVNPVTRYAGDTKFEFIEDFEGGSTLFSIDRDDNPNTVMVRSSDAPFEGGFSGLIQLDTANPVIVAQTANVYKLDPATVGRTFLELNYKTDVPIEFGLVAINPQGEEEVIFEFVVVEKEEWNKIYFDYSNLISTSGEERFAFIFRTGIPIDNGNYTLQQANVHFDNIKLVHF